MTREEAIKLLICEKVCVEDVDGNIGAERVRQAYDMAIEALQTEVVRCKDCKYGNRVTSLDSGEDILCIFSDWEYSDNDFCNRGERKGDDSE